LLLFAPSDVVDVGISDQQSDALRRGRQLRGMQAAQRSARDMQVTVTKTIEFDVEHRGRRRMVDEDSEFALTEEEQQIRTLELQMKHDLEL
jgi:hypothetical protein